MGLNIRLLHLLYISADKTYAEDVKNKALKWNSNINCPYSFSIAVIENPYQIYSQIFEKIGDGSLRLSVLIDYKSFLKYKSKLGEYTTAIRDSILCFPEINYYFDERTIDNNCVISNFLEFIIRGSGLSVSEEQKKCVITGLHTFNSTAINSPNKTTINNKRVQHVNINPYERLLMGMDNLFDASNLRFFLKELKYTDLSLHRNYSIIQKSRSKNLSLCVEEERSQSMFNCLALFLNGFRVLPITSASELRWANMNLTPQIIIRDYDLQFPDAARNWEKLKKENNIKDNSLAIYIVRGWHFDQSLKKWEEKLNSDNCYWCNLLSVPTFYVSKGAQDKEGNRTLFFEIPCTDNNEQQRLLKIGVGTKELWLPGIYKPVSGVYTPFHAINLVRKRYDDCYKEENGELPIITNRTEEGGHGVPLDIYNIVKSMVDRAENYYKKNRYVHALVVANDAIEIMNGFHQALTIRAYRCMAMAENAVAANILGGDEEELMRDTTYRLNKIEKDVTRITSIGDAKDEFNINKRKNVLNQIYNELRVYCKEKEHFEAEDSVVREIGHLNEGLSFSSLKRYIINLLKK